MDPKEFDQRQERVTELLGAVDETLDTVASQVTLLRTFNAPGTPAAILRHAGAAGAEQWVSTRCNRLGTAADTIRALAKKGRDTAEILAHLEFALGDLCRELTGAQLDLDLNAPLVKEVAKAAAEAGHPVPAATPPSKPTVPWQKLRLWKLAPPRRLEPVDPRELEIVGRDRILALGEVRWADGDLDALDSDYTTCPPWLHDAEGNVALKDGTEAEARLVLLVDDALVLCHDVQLDFNGLEDVADQMEAPGNRTVHVAWLPALDGMVRESRRLPGRHTAESIAKLDGIPEYEVTEIHHGDDQTGYTTQRSLPPLPEAETPAPEPGLGVLDPDPTDAEGTTGCPPHADRAKAAKRAAQPPRGRRAKKGA